MECGNNQIIRASLKSCCDTVSAAQAAAGQLIVSLLCLSVRANKWVLLLSGSEVKQNAVNYSVCEVHSWCLIIHVLLVYTTGTTVDRNG